MALINLRKKYKDEVIAKLMDKFGYKNKFTVPALVKIVINRGVGEAVTNSKVIELTRSQFIAISGQKPVITYVKKAISNFKIREGQAIGCKVTLRDSNMYDFLSKLIGVCMPMIRDFRGVPIRSFDGRGNYTLGIKEDNIFPEIKVDSVDHSRGFDITFVTSASTDEEAKVLLELLGLPFRKK